MRIWTRVQCPSGRGRLVTSRKAQITWKSFPALEGNHKKEVHRWAQRLPVWWFITFTWIPNSPLTSREKEVLQLIAEGKTYTQISDVLFISRETAKTHLRNIYSKLQVNKKSDAIEIASKNRYIWYHTIFLGEGGQIIDVNKKLILLLSYR